LLLAQQFLFFVRLVVKEMFSIEFLGRLLRPHSRNLHFCQFLSLFCLLLEHTC
jgi:hypothetical protein